MKQLIYITFSRRKIAIGVLVGAIIIPMLLQLQTNLFALCVLRNAMVGERGSCDSRFFTPTEYMTPNLMRLETTLLFEAAEYAELALLY